jgi:hypothetical protein
MYFAYVGTWNLAKHLKHKYISCLLIVVVQLVNKQFITSCGVHLILKSFCLLYTNFNFKNAYVDDLIWLFHI